MDQAVRHQVCRLIAGMVVSDDDLDAAEDAFIDRLLEAFDIPATDRETIFPIVDRTDAAAAILELPKDVQHEALSLLVEAAVVDGKVVPEERAYLHTVSEAMGIEAAEIDRRVNAALAARD